MNNYSELFNLNLVVNYTFGESNPLAIRMRELMAIRMIELNNPENHEVLKTCNVLKTCKVLIVDMRKELVKCGYVDDSTNYTNKYQKKFPISYLCEGYLCEGKNRSCTSDYCKYDENGNIVMLYKENGNDGKEKGHLYYNELDHYFTRALHDIAFTRAERPLKYQNLEIGIKMIELDSELNENNCVSFSVQGKGRRDKFEEFFNRKLNKTQLELREIEPEHKIFCIRKVEKNI